MKTFKQLFFIILSLGFLLYLPGCEREWNNPFDEKSGIDPESWAPQNLQIEAISITERKLTWSYTGTTNFEGFKLDRKKGDEPWQLGYQVLGKEARSWNDTNIVPDPNLNYEYRLYAFAGKNSSAHLNASSPVFFSCGQRFTDIRDNIEYQTVQIGNQCWMKENLKWLPSVSPSSNGSYTRAFFYVYGYQGTSVFAAKATANYQSYGVLYNWPAALNACPDGWHLPTDDEWLVLTGFLGGNDVAGGNMKTTGTTHWNSPNTGATNSSGFSGLPGGGMYPQGFNDLEFWGNWWSSHEVSSIFSLHRYISYDDSGVFTGSNTSKMRGFSVRCIRH